MNNMKIPKTKKEKPMAKRLKIVNTKKTGFYWMGRPCQCEVVMVHITENPDVKLYWATPFVGTERQAIKVMVAGHLPIYIDNHDGTGWIKVVHGYGAPNVFHRGIIKPEPLGAYGSDKIVPDDEIQQFDLHKYNEVERLIGEWMQVENPEMYEKAQKLRAQANQSVMNIAKKAETPGDVANNE